MNRRDFLGRSAAVSALAFAPVSVFSPAFTGRRRLETGLLVFGGGAAGICAAIQAARQGVDVVVVEPSPWIGGKLTAAGVSALDGNKHGAGGGIVHEFREGLARHYGGIEKLFTGWISLYCYEPKVGHEMLQSLVAGLENLAILYASDAVAYERDGSVRRVTVRAADGRETEIACQVFMDATEYGDGLKLAGIPYRLGRESRDEYGESAAPERADLEMQDLTYVATLLENPDNPANPEVSDLERDYWRRFECSTKLDCADPDEKRLNHTVHSWDSFITYAKLPNNKVLLNWPHHSNDYPITEAFFEDRYYREFHLQSAKLHTMQFVKYMQVALQHPEWTLAMDEYPTADHLPPIPYMRESRRLVNHHVMVQDDVVPIDGQPRAPWVQDSIAVGDYFLDHHHSKHHLPPGERLEEDFPKNAAFQMRLDVALTDHDERFLAAEKNGAVSHIVNGCTRLQPAVMLMGQALGATAALAISQGTDPARVDIRLLQDTLIGAGCPLYALYDVPRGHPLFTATQRAARDGVLRDDDALNFDSGAPIDAATARRWAVRAGVAHVVGGDGSGTLATRDLSKELRDLVPQEPTVNRGSFLWALDAVRTRTRE